LSSRPRVNSLAITANASQTEQLKERLSRMRSRRAGKIAATPNMPRSSSGLVIGMKMGMERAKPETSPETKPEKPMSSSSLKTEVKIEKSKPEKGKGEKGRLKGEKSLKKSHKHKKRVSEEPDETNSSTTLTASTISAASDDVVAAEEEETKPAEEPVAEEEETKPAEEPVAEEEEETKPAEEPAAEEEETKPAEEPVAEEEEAKPAEEPAAEEEETKPAEEPAAEEEETKPAEEPVAEEEPVPEEPKTPEPLPPRQVDQEEESSGAPLVSPRKKAKSKDTDVVEGDPNASGPVNRHRRMVSEAQGTTRRKKDRQRRLSSGPGDTGSTEVTPARHKHSKSKTLRHSKSPHNSLREIVVDPLSSPLPAAPPTPTGISSKWKAAVLPRAESLQGIPTEQSDE